MAEIAVVYHSEHHGNTKKLLDGIAASCPLDLFDAVNAEKADLSKYRAVGFASGIFMGKLHSSLYDFLKKSPALPQQAFLLYTSGSDNKKYGDGFASLLKESGLQVLGVYHCRGFDTAGPWKLLGGIAKGHPSQEDIENGVRFLQKILPETPRKTEA